MKLILKRNAKKLLVCGTLLALSVPTFADEATTTAMTTAMTGVKTDIMGMVLVALPIGLAVIASFMGIKKGIGFFKTLVSKA